MTARYLSQLFRFEKCLSVHKKHFATRLTVTKHTAATDNDIDSIRRKGDAYRNSKYNDILYNTPDGHVV